MSKGLFSDVVIIDIGKVIVCVILELNVISIRRFVLFSVLSGRR